DADDDDDTPVDDDDDADDDDDTPVDDDDDADDDDGSYPGISYIAIGYADGTVVKYEEGKEFNTDSRIDDEDFVRQFADDRSDGEWVAAYVKGGQEDLEYFNDVEGTFDWPKNPGGQVVDSGPKEGRWTPDDTGDDDTGDDDTGDDDIGDDDDQGGGPPPHAGGPGGPNAMGFQTMDVESDDDDGMIDNPLISDEGADVFSWDAGDAGDPGEPSEYTIQGFTLGEFGGNPEADKLDLADLLHDENEETIDQYIMAVEDGGDTVLYVSSTGDLDGDQGNADQMVTLEGVDMGGMDSSEFIQSLIDNGQLNIDQ
ncbi:type I secretion C-terminal target domain-containing protein, partial [Thioalkalivibrio sp. ALJ4]